MLIRANQRRENTLHLEITMGKRDFVKLEISMVLWKCIGISNLKKIRNIFHLIHKDFLFGAGYDFTDYS